MILDFLQNLTQKLLQQLRLHLLLIRAAAHRAGRIGGFPAALFQPDNLLHRDRPPAVRENIVTLTFHAPELRYDPRSECARGRAVFSRT
eukprot:SAG11_NODE_4327_length_1946_cov_2.250135_2_plen_89_part_00